MSGNKILWVEFAGLGYIAGPFASTIIPGVTLVSGDVYAVTMLWTDIYGDTDLMIDNVGARVHVDGYSNRNVPDGYYTITAATTTSVTVTGRFSVAPVAGAPTASATIRIEDFYRVCTAIPDFVTGAASRARWAPIIARDGFTATIGQEIQVRGSVSTFDGFQFTYANPSTAPIIDESSPEGASLAQTYDRLKQIVRTDPTFALSTVSGNDSIVVLSDDVEYTDTSVEKKGTSVIQPAYVSGQTTYNNDPILLDREAIIVTNSAGGTPNLDYDAIRGVLDTDAAFHQADSPFYSGLQTGQAATVRLKKADHDILTYDTMADYSELDSNGLFYIGIVENINIVDGSSKIQVELSPQIFTSAKNSPGDRLATKGKVEPYPGSENLRYILRMDSKRRELPWDWVKLGPVALRLRSPYDPATVTDKQIGPAPAGAYTGVFDTRSRIDDICWDPDYTAGYNDNWVILEKSKDDIEFEDRSRNYPLNIASAEPGDELTQQDFSTDGPSLVGRDGTLSYTAVHVRMSELIDEPAEPCHVFGSSVIPVEEDYIDLRTDSYLSLCTLADLLLQVLTSREGDGANGPFDVLPSGLGLGISQEAIDWESFGWDPVAATRVQSNVSYQKLNLILQNAVMTSKDSQKFNKWLTEKILQPVNMSLIQKDNGLHSVIDMTNFVSTNELTTVEDDDIEYDFGTKSLSVTQTYDSKKLFDRIIVTNTTPANRPSGPGQEASVTIVPSLGNGTEDEDFDDMTTRSRIFTFIQSEPLKYEHPFIARNQPNTTNIYENFAAVYGNIIPSVTFSARSSLLGIGEKFRIFLNNVINSSGGRGILGVAIVVNKKSNILSGQSIYESIILVDDLNFFSVWSASADVLAGSTPTVVNISLNSYTASITDVQWENDSEGFDPGGYVLLYDENFTMRSVDGAGLPDPRKVNSVTSTTLTLASAFTDGAGSTITPATTDIIMPATYDLQTTLAQETQSWFGRSIIR